MFHQAQRANVHRLPLQHAGLGMGLHQGCHAPVAPVSHAPLPLQLHFQRQQRQRHPQLLNVQAFATQGFGCVVQQQSTDQTRVGLTDIHSRNELPDVGRGEPPVLNQLVAFMPQCHVATRPGHQVLQGQFGQRKRDGVYLTGRTKRPEGHRKIEHKVIRVIARSQRLVLTHLLL